jgi:hypothetical protein
MPSPIRCPGSPPEHIKATWIFRTLSCTLSTSRRPHLFDGAPSHREARAPPPVAEHRRRPLNPLRLGVSKQTGATTRIPTSSCIRFAPSRRWRTAGAPSPTATRAGHLPYPPSTVATKIRQSLSLPNVGENSPTIPLTSPPPSLLGRLSPRPKPHQFWPVRELVSAGHGVEEEITTTVKR